MNINSNLDKSDLGKKKNVFCIIYLTILLLAIINFYIIELEKCDSVYNLSSWINDAQSFFCFSYTQCADFSDRTSFSPKNNTSYFI